MALLFAPPLLLLELSYTCALQQSPPPKTHTRTHIQPQSALMLPPPIFYHTTQTTLVLNLHPALALVLHYKEQY